MRPPRPEDYDDPRDFLEVSAFWRREALHDIDLATRLYVVFQVAAILIYAWVEASR